MCHKIEEPAEKAPATKLHRWLGFVQCAMMANRMLDLDGAKAMFDEARSANGDAAEYDNLIDHLDASVSFELEIGGQG